MNKLRTHLAEVASAIREKKGTSEPIVAENFAAEIRSIEGGGGDSDTILSVKVGNSTTFSWQEITEAVVHEGITTIGANGFNYAYKVTSINLPNSLLSIMRSAFDNTSALKSLHIPINVSSIAVPIARNSKVETLSVDKDNVYYDSRNNCNAIIQTATNTLILGSKSTTIPDDIVAIAESAFMGGVVEKLIFPQSLTSIAASAFSSCSKLMVCDFRAATNIPSLSNSNAFSSTPSAMKIVVPDALYDSWIAATNWSAVANKIVKSSEYTD